MCLDQYNQCQSAVRTGSASPRFSKLQKLSPTTNLPLCESSDQLLELVKAHISRVVPVQHVDHDHTGLLAEGPISAGTAALPVSQATLQLVSIYLPILREEWCVGWGWEVSQKA